MANLTLNKAETGRFFAMRTQINESGNSGDFWKGFYNDTAISNAIYNGWVTWYNTREGLCDNDELFGTKPDDGVYAIGKAPTRPVPPQRP